MTLLYDPYVGESHADFIEWARELRDTQISEAYEPTKLCLYDGDWIYAGTVAGELSSKLNPIVNETGTITVTLPISDETPEDERRTWAAHWALAEDARGTSNIHVIAEYNGARIGGRMKPEAGVRLIQDDKGDRVEIEFLDDIEELKYVHVAANPVTPLSLIQLPKAWMLAAQADHGILTTLAINLLRLALTNIDIPADLLDPDEWPDNPLDLWQQSQIVVKPRKLGDSVAPPALIVGDIRTSIFDVAAPVLEDAELQWDLQRWLTGDPEPWPGAGTDWRNGTLFVDIVNKSAFREGTSIGGNAVTGLTRFVADATSNYVEDSYDLFTGDPIDETGFRNPLLGLFTDPHHPHTVYRDGEITGIQSAQFFISPGGAGRITVGGQSMPGVNPLLEAAVTYGGDVLGDNLSVVLGVGLGVNVTVGSLGGAINAFAKPIYENTILAHMSVPLLLRVAKQGWGHYLETASTNVTQGYTAASYMDLRSRRRDTDPDTGFDFTVAQASPWLIGSGGRGDWWLGDRVGGTSKYLMPRVYVRRCRELVIDCGDGGVKVTARMGDPRAKLAALDRMLGLLSKAMGGFQQIGLL